MGLTELEILEIIASSKRCSNKRFKKPKAQEIDKYIDIANMIIELLLGKAISVYLNDDHCIGDFIPLFTPPETIKILLNALDAFLGFPVKLSDYIVDIAKKYNDLQETKIFNEIPDIDILEE